MLYLDARVPGLTVKFICPDLSGIMHKYDKLRRAEAVAQFCVLCLCVQDRHRSDSVLLASNDNIFGPIIMPGDVPAPTLDPPNFVPMDGNDRRVSSYSV